MCGGLSIVFSCTYGNVRDSGGIHIAPVRASGVTHIALVRASGGIHIALVRASGGIHIALVVLIFAPAATLPLTNQQVSG